MSISQAPGSRATSPLGELRALLVLALPIVVVQVGMVGMNTVDVAMLGRYGAASLSAMTVGNTLSWATLVFCMGVLMVADPLLSQAVGAGDRDAVTRTLLRGVCLAALLSVPAMLLLLPAETWLRALHQPDEIVQGAATYARINALGVFPFLLFSLFRQALNSFSKIWPVVLVIAWTNVVNAGLNWLLIWGHAGFPELGVAGAAWATVGSRWMMALLLPLVAARQLLPHLRAMFDGEVRRRALRWGPVLAMLRLGAPIGVQLSLEMGVFAATALLMGVIGAAEVAGHQLAINLASLSFMLPVGLGIASSVRVGWAVGRADSPATRRVAWVSLGSAAVVMAGFSVLFLSAPRMLAGLYTDDAATIALAAALIPIAGVFQVFDGLQVVAVGLLRGLGDTRSPMVINAVGFWLLGLPLGCVLAFGFGFGPAGLWWGLMAGLVAVAAILVWMVRRRVGQERHARLVID